MIRQIYYLDDESSLLEVFHEYMTAGEYEVLTFELAEAGLAACRAALPDLLVIDYRLAEMTADDFLGQLGSEVKTILVSGELGLKPQHAFTHFVPKPFRLEELKALIDQLLS